MKIRRQGRSLAVTLDAETLRAAGLREGDLVQPSAKNGKVVLTAVTVSPRVRRDVLKIGRRVVRERRKLLARLAKYDEQ